MPRIGPCDAAKDACRFAYLLFYQYPGAAGNVILVTHLTFLDAWGQNAQP